MVKVWLGSTSMFCYCWSSSGYKLVTICWSDCPEQSQLEIVLQCVALHSCYSQYKGKNLLTVMDYLPDTCLKLSENGGCEGFLRCESPALLTGGTQEDWHKSRPLVVTYVRPGGPADRYLTAHSCKRKLIVTAHTVTVQSHTVYIHTVHAHKRTNSHKATCTYIQFHWNISEQIHKHTHSQS